MEIRSTPQTALDPKPKMTNTGTMDFGTLVESSARVVRDSVSISTTGTLRSLQYVEKEIKANLSRVFMEEVFGTRSETISPRDLVDAEEEKSQAGKPATHPDPDVTSTNLEP
ncbi:MAG: hypothetical protein H7833_01935 [Magnetococcus sp. DMHC-1]|nr:hypothetical protein [Magnetococcales bacterium]